MVRLEKSRPFYAFYNWFFSFFLGKPTIDHSTFATQHSKEEQQQLGDAKNPLHLAFFSRWACDH